MKVKLWDYKYVLAYCLRKIEVFCLWEMPHKIWELLRDIRRVNTLHLKTIILSCNKTPKTLSNSSIYVDVK